MLDREGSNITNNDNVDAKHAPDNDHKDDEYPEDMPPKTKPTTAAKALANMKKPSAATASSKVTMIPPCLYKASHAVFP
jgi:hypothetical protein